MRAIARKTACIVGDTVPLRRSGKLNRTSADMEVASRLVVSHRVIERSRARKHVVERAGALLTSRKASLMPWAVMGSLM